MKARCPRIENYFVTKVQCKHCEKYRGPCDYAESIQAILTDLAREGVTV